MKPIHRTVPGPSWAAEVVELAAIFFAVGLVHLFVSLVGEHADGGVMLALSGAALIAGTALHRWWGARHHRHTTATRTEALTVRDLLSIPAADRELLRLRTTLPDRPGSLAALSGQLAAHDVNILAIQVHPAVDGAVDELLLAVPRDVAVERVADAVRAGGGTLTHAAPADAHDLVDPSTRALTIAAQTVRDPSRLRPALLHLLSAEAVTDRPSAGAAQIHGPDGRPLYLLRPALSFTPTELSRAQALIDLTYAGLTEEGRRSTGRGAPNR
jgi:predicted amino acid-binding ACT domain protein